jgi:uncharacterized paraquat-inducible protein A
MSGRRPLPFLIEYEEGVMALEQTQAHCNRCGKPTLHQRTTSGPPHLGCLLILLTCIVLSFLLPIISWIITVPVILLTLVAWFVSILFSSLSQQPYRCTQCGQIAGELTAEQEASIARQRDLEEARLAPLREEQARARAAEIRRAWASFVAATQSGFQALLRLSVKTARQADCLLLKMAGGEDNKILYRFLQVLAVSIPVGAILIAMVISSSNRRAEQARIEVANQEVRQAVEKADKWIQDGSLADADQVEEGLNAAEANAVATQKTSVGPTLVAFRKKKSERQATAISGER